ncbi:caspase family protein [bacterium]|nr:caspase family protein [bacterium]
MNILEMYRYWFLVTVSVVLVITCSANPAHPASEIEAAVVIGISEHEDKSIGSGGYADQDAELIAYCLETILGVEKSAISLLVNDRACRADIETHIARRVSSKKKSGILLVYYSGKGWQGSDPSGDEDDGKDEFLVPYDAVSNDESSLIRDDELAALLRPHTGKILLVFDTCFFGANDLEEFNWSEGELWGGVCDIEDGLKGRDVVQFSSVEEGERAISEKLGPSYKRRVPWRDYYKQRDVNRLNRAGHGAFTRAILQSIGDLSTLGNLDGYITTKELFESVSNIMLAEQYNGYFSQTPTYISNSIEQCIIARVAQESNDTGILEVNMVGSQESAEIMIDGVFRGCGWVSGPLREGKHELSVRIDGAKYTDYEEEIYIEKGKHTIRVIDLRSKTRFRFWPREAFLGLWNRPLINVSKDGITKYEAPHSELSSLEFGGGWIELSHRPRHHSIFVPRCFVFRATEEFSSLFGAGSEVFCLSAFWGTKSENARVGIKSLWSGEYSTALQVNLDSSYGIDINYNIPLRLFGDCYFGERLRFYGSLTHYTALDTPRNPEYGKGDLSMRSHELYVSLALIHMPNEFSSYTSDESKIYKIVGEPWRALDIFARLKRIFIKDNLRGNRYIDENYAIGISLSRWFDQ